MSYKVSDESTQFIVLIIFRLIITAVIVLRGKEHKRCYQKGHHYQVQVNQSHKTINNQKDGDNYNYIENFSLEILHNVI